MKQEGCEDMDSEQRAQRRTAVIEAFIYALDGKRQDFIYNVQHMSIEERATLRFVCEKIPVEMDYIEWREFFPWQRQEGE